MANSKNGPALAALRPTVGALNGTKKGFFARTMQQRQTRYLSIPTATSRLLHPTSVTNSYPDADLPRSMPCARSTATLVFTTAAGARMRRTSKHDRGRSALIRSRRRQARCAHAPDSLVRHAFVDGAGYRSKYGPIRRSRHSHLHGLS